MKKILLALLSCMALFRAYAQENVIPHNRAEDKYKVMSDGYWDIWNDEEQARIDADIEKYRKSDGHFKVGNIKEGTIVKVEQTASEFVFGASAFNWNQLGSRKANTAYRELFGTLFNRATIPFYWSTFEPTPGNTRFKESVIDQESWWFNGSRKSNFNWRRPPTDIIVDWCNEHGVAVHGHPLIWGNRKTYPKWMLSEDVPEEERRALDSLEIIISGAHSMHCASYKKMSEQQIADLVPEYIKLQEQKYFYHAQEIINHYKGRIQSWDVVNESAVDFDRGLQDPSLPMCKSVYGIMFPDYTYRSFKAVASYSKDGALLNINDYVVSDAYASQVSSLLRRGAKIDVIGSQMHLFKPEQCLDIAAGKHLGKDKLVEPVPIRKFFEKLGASGKPTALSEITITSAGEGGRGEMIQAIIARNLYRVWFSLPSMMGITWWNLVDGCGAAGEPAISGIFHRNMTPKLSYFALDELINHEWRTNEELDPDVKGVVSWRGFKGTYRISWTDAAGVAHQETYILK